MAAALCPDPWGEQKLCTFDAEAELSNIHSYGESDTLKHSFRANKLLDSGQINDSR